MSETTLKTLTLVLGVGFWLISQARFAKTRTKLPSQIQDFGHLFTRSLYARVKQNLFLQKALLITSSLWIDLCGTGLIVHAVLSKAWAPTLSLVALTFLRQGANALVALPVPDEIIWDSPGIPSLFVRYGKSSNLFFSGHTAFAILATLECFHSSHPTLGWICLAGALYQAGVVLVLRAHWSMDILSGTLAAFATFSIRYI